MFCIRPLIRKKYHGKDLEAFNSSQNITEKLFAFRNKFIYEQLSHQIVKISPVGGMLNSPPQVVPLSMTYFHIPGGWEAKQERINRQTPAEHNQRLSSNFEFAFFLHWWTTVVSEGKNSQTSTNSNWCLNQKLSLSLLR